MSEHWTISLVSRQKSSSRTWVQFNWMLSCIAGYYFPTTRWRMDVNNRFWESCTLMAMLPLQPEQAGHLWASLWLDGWCFSFLYRTGSLCRGTRCVPGSALKPRRSPWWGSEVKRMASSVSQKKARPLPLSPPPPPGRRAKWVKQADGVRWWCVCQNPSPALPRPT